MEKGEVLKGANQALGGSVNPQRRVHRGALTTPLASGPSSLGPPALHALEGPLLSKSLFPPLWKGMGRGMQEIQRSES